MIFCGNHNNYSTRVGTLRDIQDVRDSQWSSLHAFYELNLFSDPI